MRAFLLCGLRVLRSTILWLAVLRLSAAVVALVRHDCGTFCKLSAQPVVGGDRGGRKNEARTGCEMRSDDGASVCDGADWFSGSRWCVLRKKEEG